jgi:hypothetical protein
MTTRESTSPAAQEIPEAATEATSETPETIEERYPEGTYAHDDAKGKSGLVVDHWAGKVHLRPVSGGIEWGAKPDDLRPMEASEALRPAIREVNGATR